MPQDRLYAGDKSGEIPILPLGSMAWWAFQSSICQGCNNAEIPAGASESDLECIRGNFVVSGSTLALESLHLKL